MAQILVVEDDVDTRQALTRILEDRGYGVTAANNGWEALLALDQQKVDLIVLDILMPGMDGSTFSRIIRGGAGKKQRIPIVVLTALDAGEAYARLGAGEVAAVITKRNNAMERVVPTIEQVLENGGGKGN